MDSIIDLLHEKNNCLEKFYRLNEAQMDSLARSDFENLEAFYSDREGLLTLIRKIDEMIEHSNQIPLDAEEIDAAMRGVVTQALHYKNELVSRILEQDLKILSAIENAKSTIIKELTQVRATKKALGSYKSRQPSARLDEEI